MLRRLTRLGYAFLKLLPLWPKRDGLRGFPDRFATRRRVRLGLFARSDRLPGWLCSPDGLNAGIQAPAHVDLLWIYFGYPALAFTSWICAVWRSVCPERNNSH